MSSWLRRARRRVLGRELHLWNDPAYRPPITALESSTGMEPRRAGWVAWYLVDGGWVARRCLHAPHRITYRDLARAHHPEYLDSLDRPGVLSDIFGVDPSALPIHSVMTWLRLACGGTLEASRSALARRAPSLNLLGGFHHAEPGRGGALCALNDIAVAIAVLRDEGFHGTVAILDLDAHPPDGLAAFFGHDPDVWVGSLSGADWGPLEGVDETLLPAGCDDDTYLQALEKLLARMPRRPALTMVIAGGDVLAGDHLGGLALTLDGARRRDLAVARKLQGLPSVWLPGGGYSEQAWKVLAGTGMALVLGSRRPISDRRHPMTHYYATISAQLNPQELEGDQLITEADLKEALGFRSVRRRRLLGYYTVEGIEYALSRYGILDYLRRLGFASFRVVVEADYSGDRFRLHGTAAGAEHILIETLLARLQLDQGELLYIHWMTLRNPTARFSDTRPRLPGQDTPGLGLAREAILLLGQMAKRLNLDGLAYRPAHAHTAYPSRHDFRFLDPARQGRFEALLDDLDHLSLLELTTAMDQERIQLNGQPYLWEADLMVRWLTPVEEGMPERMGAQWHEAVASERQQVQFSVVDPT
ncbi:MAG: histone deacetylase [Myxococcota bacterium]